MQCNCKSGILFTNTLKFAKTNPNAIIPSKELENGGFDIYACFEENSIIIEPHETKLIPTGIASAFDSDYVLLARERGSTCKCGLSIRSGVIDSGYRGEIFIGLTNTSSKPVIIDKFPCESDNDIIYYPYTKAIAQLLLIPIAQIPTEEISYEELKAIPSNRGTGMLGSSGK